MLNYKVKIGLVPMRRNTTNRPPKTFLTWVSAEERGHRFVKYIEDNFTSEHVEFVNVNGMGHNDLIFDDDSAAAVVEKFQNKKVVVVGSGLSGIAAAKLLERVKANITIFEGNEKVTETNVEEPVATEITTVEEQPAPIVDEIKPDMELVEKMINGVPESSETERSSRRNP